MKTGDRIAAVDTSAAAWEKSVPELPLRDVQLMRLLRVLSMGLTAVVDPMLRPDGLTESSYHTLIITMSAGSAGISPSALCEQVGQARANMTRILDLLAGRGWVRIDAMEHDRRHKRACITAKGRGVVRRHARALAPVTLTALSGLTEKDKDMLEDILRRLAASLDQAERFATPRAGEA